MNPIAKRIITALLTASLVICAILFAPQACFRPVCLVLMALTLLELLLLLRRKWREAPGRAIAAGVAFGLLVGLMFSILPVVANRFGNVMLLYLIAIVKFSDMGGFAIGLGSKKLMGDNHRMCPSISPNKSWEGLAGSVVASVLMSLAFLPFTHFGVMKAVIFGIVAALVGTFGDLVESKLKRWVGVKDSATFMPAGLGGFLDMFDSLLFAPIVLLPFV